MNLFGNGNLDRDHRVYYSYLYQFDMVGNRTSLARDLHQEPVFAEGESAAGKKEKDNGKFGEKTKPSFWNLPGHSAFSYISNKENQLIQVRDVREDTTYIADYRYDNNGNLIEKKEYKQTEPTKAEITAYIYDYENRLIKIIYPDNAFSEYKYDGAGKRIQSIENGGITKYLYDGLNVIIKRDGLDNTLVTYTRGLSYGGGIGGIISSSTHDAQSATQYYHYDGIGSVTGLTDATGKTIQTYTYDAYGNILKQIELASANSYQFSTKEYDSKSGLSYFGTRYYDSRVGRWLTRDSYAGNTFRPSSLHKYLYVENNPVNLRDPWGLTIEIIGDGDLTAAVEKLKQSPTGRWLYDELNNLDEKVANIKINRGTPKYDPHGDYNNQRKEITLNIERIKQDKLPLVALLGHEIAHAYYDIFERYKTIPIGNEEAYSQLWALRLEAVIRKELGKPPR